MFCNVVKAEKLKGAEIEFICKSFSLVLFLFLSEYFIRMVRFFACLMLCCLFVGRPAAVSQQKTFRHFSVADGLPNYSVISIAQDHTGFMWIGTTAGLCRYDGIRFKVYRSEANDTTSLSSGHISSLYTGSDGTLWVGSSGGLDRYDPERDAFVRIRFNGNPAGNVFKVYEDLKGRVWVGTDNGLFSISPQGKTTSFEKKISGNIVKGIFEDSKGRMWIGTDQGLNCLEFSGGEYRGTRFKPFREDRANRVTSVIEDASHMIWIGMQDDGLCAFDPDTKTFTTYKTSAGLVNDHIRCITPDGAGNLWIGTQEGISILDPARKTFQNVVRIPGEETSLSQNSVFAIFKDRVGSMWVGTYFGGVNISYAYNASFSVIKDDKRQNSISNNVVSSMVDDPEGNLWIGTEGGGVNYFSRASRTFTYYKHEPQQPFSLRSNLIKVVYRDSDGNIWVGTHGGGLNVLLPDGKHFSGYLVNPPGEKIISEVTSVTDDDAGNFWVATNTALRVFRRNGTNLSNGREVHPPIRGQLQKYFFKDSRNTIWVFGATGVNRIEKGRIQEADTALVVNCFAENSRGELWGGTWGNGAVKFDGQKFVTFTNPFFKSVNILGILCGEKEDLWLSTNRGLVHFFPETGIYQLYTENDGIAGNEFNYNSYFKSTDGYFYFGGYNGLTYFRPDNIRNNPHKAPFVFTHLRLHGGEEGQEFREENITQKPEVSVRYDQNTFTVDFALLNYIKSGKNRYQYRLEDYDKAWKETSEGSATYTNLPPGAYRLLVKGANNDGVWSDVKTLDITVRPPFWLSWWAYCIYILLAGGMVFVIARFFFMRELLKKEDELHQAKLNFFTNASHEIRTHLTLIMVPVERLLNESPADHFVRQQLSQVRANTNRLLNLVRELMDFRKAETNHLQLFARRQNLVPFLQEIWQSFRETALASNINMSFIHNEDSIEVNFDEKQLEKVFFNLLANAIKFTPENGRIELYAEARKEEVRIRITDNGRGIAPQFLPRLFTNFFQVADHGMQNTGYGIGLALSKNIVELHKGRISVESIPAADGVEGKTVFTVVLPENAEIATASPLVSETAYRGNEQMADTRATEEVSTRQKGCTILVVEDNPDIRQMLIDCLSPVHRVMTAENGRSGWEKAIAEIPELVISDVMMPEMDGYELCEKIKSDERTSHIPVILLTAKSAQNEQIQGLQQGADLYLTKPFSTRVLGLSVRNLLTARDRIRQKTTKELTSLNLNRAGIEPATASVDDLFLEKMIRIIDEHLDHLDFGVEKLAREVGMSLPVLYKKVRALTNMSVNEVVKVHRFRKAAELLVQQKISISEVAGAVGYDDRKYFAKEFKKYFGVAPSDFTSSAIINIPTGK